MSQTLGEGAARLSILTFANIVSAANSDPTCGFDSPSASMQTSGTLGRAGGSATWTIEGCVIELPTPTVVSTDCLGNRTVLQGRAVVSGTKTITGILTGDSHNPVVPTSRDPATITITADLTGLTVTSEYANGDAPMGLTSTGRLTGTLMPRTARDRATGACSLTTPVAEMRDVRWIGDADLYLMTGGLTLGVTVGAAELDAVNGQKGPLVNLLSGSIDVEGTPVAFTGIDLNPTFHAPTFDAGYQCDPEMVVPATDRECDFEATLAQNAARLLVKTFGNVVKATESQETCGFSAIDNMVPDAVGEELGEEVTAVWNVSECQVGGDYLLFTDCNGRDTWVSGSAVVTATKTVQGRLAAGYPPIHPTTRTAVRFDMHEVVLEEFSIVDYDFGSDEPEPTMVVHQARVTGISRPITGEAADTPGAYFIASPVTSFDDIRIEDADVTIVADGMSFDLHIDASDIDAFNGAFNGRRNELLGRITVEGKVYDLPVSPTDPYLDPAYDQAFFDSTYVCYENLAEPIPVP